MIPWYHTAVHPDAQEQAFHSSLLPRKSYGQPPAEVPAKGDCTVDLRPVRVPLADAAGKAERTLAAAAQAAVFAVPGQSPFLSGPPYL